MQTSQQQQYYVPSHKQQPEQVHWTAIVSLCFCGVNITCSLALFYLRLFPGPLAILNSIPVNILLVGILYLSILIAVYTAERAKLYARLPFYGKSKRWAVFGLFLAIALGMGEFIINFFW
jgi:hypothetical protein